MFQSTKTTFAKAVSIIILVISGCGGFITQYSLDPDWSRVEPVPTKWILHDVWGTSPTDVFAVGDVGTILHFDGIKWSQMDAGKNYYHSTEYGELIQTMCM